MTDDADEQPVIIDGDLQAALDFPELQRFATVLKEAGFDVDFDFSAGDLTIRRPADARPVQLTDEYEDLAGGEIVDKVREEQTLNGSETTAEDESKDVDNDTAGSESADADTDNEAGEPQTADDTETESDTDLATDGSEAVANGDDNQVDEPSADADTGQSTDNLTKRERRVQRLNDGIEPGEPYTTTELAAIAYNKVKADVTASDEAYVSNLRREGAIDLNERDDPTRDHHAAKLYYRGDKPDVEEDEAGNGEEGEESPEMSSSAVDAAAEPSVDDVADCGCPLDDQGEPMHYEACPEAAAADIDAMQELYEDDEEQIRELIDTMEYTNQEIADEVGVDVDAVKAVRDDHALDDAVDDEEDLLAEIGPVALGKIAAKGVFQRYECKCGKEFNDENDAMNHSHDTGHTHGWKAYDQIPKDSDKAIAKVSGASTMR